jgi:tetratricopeptide (TPR) repeat protein
VVSALADRQQRLGLLDAAGDPHTAVRAVFSWSYRHLDPGAARAFRLAALHPGPDLDPYAVAALTGMPLAQARQAVRALSRAHLIQAAAPGRHGMHDLLRAYGRELAEAVEGDTGQHAALTGLLDHYRHAAAVAMDTLYAYERHRRPAVPAAAAPAPPLGTPAAARAWLDTERATLVAVTVHAAAHGWPGHAIGLATTLWRYLDTGSYCTETLAIQAAARRAARLTGDRVAEGLALNYLAGVYRLQSRPEEAARHLQQALGLFRRAGERSRQAHALINLGIITQDQGRYDRAERLYRQALRVYDEIGEPAVRGRATGGLGEIEERQGRYDLAARHQEEKLTLAYAAGDHVSECYALVGLGAAILGQGRWREAAEYLDQGLARSRAVGLRQAEAEALARIGDLRLRQGSPREAAGRLHEALAVYREIGSRGGEAGALNTLGQALLAAGQPGEAACRHAEALALADQAGEKYEQARARQGLGDASHATGDPGAARVHWTQALARYAELGVPAAARVRARLGEPGSPAPARSG